MHGDTWTLVISSSWDPQGRSAGAFSQQPHEPGGLHSLGPFYFPDSNHITGTMIWTGPATRTSSPIRGPCRQNPPRPPSKADESRAVSPTRMAPTRDPISNWAANDQPLCQLHYWWPAWPVSFWVRRVAHSGLS